VGDSRDIVIFGAGNIGRGLIGELARGGGWRPIFVEADRALAQELIAAGRYSVHLVGQLQQQREVDRFDVLHTEDAAAIAKAISGCRFAATAVGGQALPSLARLLAPGIADRAGPLNIVLCENVPHSDEVLRRALGTQGASPERFACVPASVERIARRGDHRLDIVAEGGQTLYVDRSAWVGQPPVIEGMTFCDDLESMYKRKLFTNNAGHALLAYLGAQAGCRYIHEALEVPSIREHLRELLNVAGEALVRQYRMDATEMGDHLDALIHARFANRELADTVKRVARDPLRKLAPDERLVGLLRLLREHGLPTISVSRAIAAALRYVDPDDAESSRLQELVSRHGPEHVLLHVCGIEPAAPCLSEIVATTEDMVRQHFG